MKSYFRTLQVSCTVGRPTPGSARRTSRYSGGTNVIFTTTSHFDYWHMSTIYKPETKAEHFAFSISWCQPDIATEDLHVRVSSLSLSLSLSFSHTHSLNLSLSLSLIHTHSLSLYVYVASLLILA